MSGFYRDGEWVSAVVGGPTESAEEAERACAEALKRVENGESTARIELRELLTRYPILKKNRPDTPLLPFAAHFANEVLGL
jgi:hypothetical protein